MGHRSTRSDRTVMLRVSRERPDGQPHLLADPAAVLFVLEHPLSRHACDLLAEPRHTLGDGLFGWDADGATRPGSASRW